MSDKHVAQYIAGLKVITENFAQRENRWNELMYSWYALRKTHGIDTCFTVDFSVKDAKKYTARGLYYQKAPFEQDLLISCERGCAEILVLDLRKDSDTYLLRNGILLDADIDQRRVVFVPRGCAYGFVTLADHTRINFKASNYCNNEFEQIYNMLDPYFAIRVPYPDKNAARTRLSDLLVQGDLVMSVQDRCAPFIIDVVAPMTEKKNEATTTASNETREMAE